MIIGIILLCDIKCCAETRFSHTSELLLPNFNKQILSVCRISLPHTQDLLVYSQVGFNTNRFTKYDIVVSVIIISIVLEVLLRMTAFTAVY